MNTLRLFGEFAIMSYYLEINILESFQNFTITIFEKNTVALKMCVTINTKQYMYGKHRRKEILS